MNYMLSAIITEVWVEVTIPLMPKIVANGMNITTVLFVPAAKEALEVQEPICCSTRERIDLITTIEYD